MEKKELKNLVAGLSIAGLIAGAGLTMTGCVTACSGTKKDGAGSTQTEEPAKKKPASGGS